MPSYYCRKCHRQLKNPVSVSLGIGPVCLLRERVQQAETCLSYPKLLGGDENSDNKGGSGKLPEPQKDDT